MKNLPLDIQTEVNGYLFYAFPYSIINSFQEYKDYITENYLQCFGFLEYSNDRYTATFEYEDGIGYRNILYNSGPLEMVFYPYDFGLKLNVKKHIISEIDNDNYVVIFLDEYYIKSRPAYQKYNFTHELLIFGYDDENFNYIAFDGSQKLSFSSFPQKQINNAYKMGSFLIKKDPLYWVNDRSMISIKLRGLQERYNFDSLRFVEKLKSYLSGKLNSSYSSFVIPGEKCYAGVYNTNLILYCFGNPEQRSVNMHYPGVHIWFESKKNLLDKLKYFYKKNNFEDDGLFSDYEEKVIKQANLIRLIFLKFEKTHKIDINRSVFLLKDIFNSEVRILNNIVNNHDKLINEPPRGRDREVSVS